MKLIHPMSDENPSEAYLILHDLDEYSDSDIFYIVSVTDLQRNIHNPAIAPRKAVTKSELALVAESLQEYVESWNK